MATFFLINSVLAMARLYTAKSTAKKSTHKQNMFNKKKTTINRINELIWHNLKNVGFFVLFSSALRAFFLTLVYYQLSYQFIYQFLSLSHFIKLRDIFTY